MSASCCRARGFSCPGSQAASAATRLLGMESFSSDDAGTQSRLSLLTGILASSFSKEEVPGLVALGGALSLLVLAILSLADFEIAQSLLLLCVGALCVQGEILSRSSTISPYQSVIQENFGFVLKPLGRGFVYGLASLHCLAYATGMTIADHGTLYHMAWYLASLLSVAGAVCAVLIWRSSRTGPEGYTEPAAAAATVDLESFTRQPASYQPPRA
eukprot:TRINITY_DN22571_c0_g1_i5.p1 TRINITY_DN22571_c0_g1~~TRINITY_DN22571_c0_g1_i5.p1  ORF type:complete len:226 (+),score=22.44 TRINITY_DN22571_c0_g1_i5:36-680(+)